MEEDGSSEGNGSSYFSGEVIERMGSIPGSHVSLSPFLHTLCVICLRQNQKSTTRSEPSPSHSAQQDETHFHHHRLHCVSRGVGRCRCLQVRGTRAGWMMIVSSLSWNQ